MALYEFFLLGVPTAAQSAAIEARLREAADEFQLVFGTDILLAGAGGVSGRNPMAASAAVYFAGDPGVDGAIVDELIAAGIPVIPTIAKGAKIETGLPDALKPTNASFIEPADQAELHALAATLLECAGLLHEQRRVFISYRRTSSREVAVQLHDELAARGFDIFLDTHDIRAGHPFQEMLWHRLSDCDILIMLDTADYFDSKWTREEFAKAQLKEIHILRLVWPDNHKPAQQLAISDLMQLAPADLTAGSQLAAPILDEVVKRAERLRSRSIATRHLSMLGKLKLEVTSAGGTCDAIGAHRSVSVSLPRGTRLLVYAAVGIPSAPILHDIVEKAQRSGHMGRPLLIFDHLGIREKWLRHLTWLDAEIGTVATRPVSGLAWELVTWDS